MTEPTPSTQPPSRLAQANPARLPLCADVSRAAGEDPIGTAPHWQEVTVLELDVPVWARVRDSAGWTPEQREAMERLGEKVKAQGQGFGLLMSAPQRLRNPLRVRHYTLGAGGYSRQDYALDVPQTEWARGLTDTLLEPGRLSAWEKLPVPDGPDYHVCTHGTIDASCGRYGVPVFAALQQAGLRGWRTGHFGGHRFAATAVELPSGMVWAHLTPELALKVARREVSPAEVRLNMRGFAGVKGLAQILDRELLLRHGWEWLDAHRWAETDGEDVTLHYVWQGITGTTRAQVRESGCNHLPGSSHKPDLHEFKQYEVVW